MGKGIFLSKAGEMKTENASSTAWLSAGISSAPSQAAPSEQQISDFLSTCWASERLAAAQFDFQEGFEWNA